MVRLPVLIGFLIEVHLVCSLFCVLDFVVVLFCFQCDKCVKLLSGYIWRNLNFKRSKVMGSDLTLKYARKVAHLCLKHVYNILTLNCFI